MRIMKTSSVRSWLCHSKWLVVSAILAIALSFPLAAQTNILDNPGFESGNYSGWITNGPNSSVLSTIGYAHGGSFFYKVYGRSNSSYNYAGINQDLPAAPGSTYSADGWTFSLGSDGGGIHGQDLIWIEVSFRDSSNNTLALYRSTVVDSNLLYSLGGVNHWIDLQITNQCSFTNASALILLPGTVTNTVSTLVAPPGTASVRYQVIFEQGPDNANGSMYFDDLTLNQTSGPLPQRNIVWSDEFNQADNSLPDLSKWGFDTGGGGFGNNELENYTTTNARILGGQLVIETDRYLAAGKTNYTSTRMNTKGKWSWAYGRMEARIKIPRGQGIWPAFWMLGSNFNAGVPWPTCGEIDIMENIGKTSDQGTDHGTIHGPQSGGDYNGGSGVGSSYTLPGGAALADAFHIYAIEWKPNQIKWYLDSIQFFTATPASVAGLPGGQWVFTQPQFFIMNVAVGGNWPGYPDATTVFPQQMLVDYVRVYQTTLPLAISLTPQPDGSMSLSWPNNIVCHLQVQTNSLDGGSWSDLPVTTSPYVVTPDPSQTVVFYRLVSP
jgi:beta-glucanase (GH16 family)